MKIISVVGARPNFMKMAPVHKALSKQDGELTHLICHTGQHYDEKMSKVFFEDLELPRPDFYLGIGSGSHAEQTARIMVEFEKILLQEKPELIIVYGDVNSTVACALTAAKLNIKVAHVESGLRSFDRTMPEEINRIVTDHLCDYLFVSEPSGVNNLKQEGIRDDKVFFVGNTMIDSLVSFLEKAEQSSICEKLNLENTKYLLITMHRPSNVDNDKYLIDFLTQINILAKKIKIVFPVHPRTLKNLEAVSFNLSPNIIITEPLGYIDFITLMKNSHAVVTDSGGIQEETTYLGVPCFTLRKNTERPVTISKGTNRLVTFDNFVAAVTDKINYNMRPKLKPELWDGNAAERITQHLLKLLNINRIISLANSYIS